jgi:(1->4)-alpha-D-glucan 1-alpha-D-glucosylmutase
VDGTTGYEFANALRGLWVDPNSERVFTDLYARLTGDRRSFDQHVYESKLQVIRFSFASELNALAIALERIANHHRRSRDFTRGGLVRALTEVLAAFPIYRTYLRGARERLDARREIDGQVFGEVMS